MGLEIFFTSPHYGDGDPAIILGQSREFKNANVKIPWKDWRTAEFDISIYDPMIQSLRELWGYPEPFANLVHIRHRGTPVFWGPIESFEVDTRTNRMKVFAKDPGHYLEHHYIVRGDEILGGQLEKHSPPLDYRLLRLLRDAAEPPQISYPVLGIKDGTNDAPTETRLWVVERGQELATTWKNISLNTIGPDWELETLPLDAADLNYCKLNTYEDLSRDRTQEIQFEAGFGQNNCEVVYRPGGKIITHAHVIYGKNKIAVNRGNASLASYYGVHVHWDTLDAKGVSAEVAAAHADGLLKAYGAPLDNYDVIPKRAGELKHGQREINYPDDVLPGDIVYTKLKKGYIQNTGWTQIVNVELQQKDYAGETSLVLAVRPAVSGGLTDTEDLE